MVVIRWRAGIPRHTLWVIGWWGCRPLFSIGLFTVVYICFIHITCTPISMLYAFLYVHDMCMCMHHGYGYVYVCVCDVYIHTYGCEYDIFLPV